MINFVPYQVGMQYPSVNLPRADGSCLGRQENVHQRARFQHDKPRLLQLRPDDAIVHRQTRWNKKFCTKTKLIFMKLSPGHIDLLLSYALVKLVLMRIFLRRRSNIVSPSRKSPRICGSHYIINHLCYHC